MRERSVADDAPVEKAARSADLALVGADRLLPTGAIVNGAPTLSVAVACRQAGRPFYVACDTFKLDAARTREPGFDFVPARLVSGIFTERGLLAASEVKRLVAR